MKFFTVSWWQGGSGDDPFPLYEEHLASIRDKLPDEVLKLEEEVRLHDSNLRNMILDIPSACVSLVLDGGDGEGNLRRFHLRYSGVSRVESISDPNFGLVGPHGYGDYGYDELDLDSNGLPVHRILFSSGIEIHIHFGAFDVEYSDEIDS